MMTIKTPLVGVMIIQPEVHYDPRGWFQEQYNSGRAEALMPIVAQVNRSMSHLGVIRGLHYQTGKHAQAKLVRCVTGSILDVAVDLRPGSATFGKYASQVLTQDNGLSLFIPVGFAHGFCAMEDCTEVQYMASAPYSPEHEAGIRWDDPELAIEWPACGALLVSPKDKRLPSFSEVKKQLTKERTPWK